MTNKALIVALSEFNTLTRSKAFVVGIVMMPIFMRPASTCTPSSVPGAAAPCKNMTCTANDNASKTATAQSSQWATKKRVPCNNRRGMARS